MITRSASTGSWRTISARPGPVGTTPLYPRSSWRRNASPAASTASGLSAVHSASVVWPVWSMRMSRAIGPPRFAVDPMVRLHAELLARNSADLAAVRPALGLAHHVADDRPDRLLLAGADLLGGVGVGVDRRLDEPLELVAVAHRPQALGLDDRGRLAALG